MGLTALHDGDESRARRELRINLNAEDRRAFDAFAPTRRRGRPTGSRRGVCDAAYRKAYALYDLYAFYWRANRKASAALAKLAEINDTEQDSIKRQMVRARKRLTVADRKMIEAVAGSTPKSG